MAGPSVSTKSSGDRSVLSAGEDDAGADDGAAVLGAGSADDVASSPPQADTARAVATATSPPRHDAADQQRHRPHARGGVTRPRVGPVACLPRPCTVRTPTPIRPPLHAD
ncbi:hypothetical protein CC117_09595 [Parafrankia colletiae]|uniref:Uncharacterized protein n=1 Tax=Parafrankia colletiae TaxID=573497 RepID=A0A1S1RGS6_9ACTN|nr:hypothetical protein CC117_09595 [Parafrankia colletiae]